MPLEVHLDIAKQVVLGQITKIEEIDQRLFGDGVRAGRATIAVTETLKGLPAQSVELIVATSVDRNYGGSSPQRVHKVGDRGIWLIAASGIVSHSFGLLPEKCKADVQRIVMNLEKRKWSEPVNGLCAWAAAVYPNYQPENPNAMRKTPVIIFALKNLSETDIFVPTENSAGMITAVVTDHAGKVARYVLGSATWKNERVFCRKLAAGDIVYLHPDYSFIDLPRSERLADDKYKVVLECSNEKEGESAMSIGERRVPVTSWKGKVSAPPVELDLTRSETKVAP
jgi:hypothetical protein